MIFSLLSAAIVSRTVVTVGHQLNLRIGQEEHSYDSLASSRVHLERSRLINCTTALRVKR
jgi:hypothetical protein